MSYRFRFASANKEYIDTVRNMSYEELIEYTKKNNPKAYNDFEEEGEYLSIWNLFKQDEIFDMGDCPYAEDIINVSTNLFTNNDTNEYFTESDLQLCDKNAFLMAIEGMRLLVKANFDRMLTNPNLVQAYLKEKQDEWSNFTDIMNCNDIPEERKNKLNNTYRPYNLKEDNSEIVSSWRYEYAIFEMVRLFKTFDWENNYLLFYGW